MKKLQKYINIIPVVSSKEIDIDEEDIEAYKDSIASESSDYHLEFGEIQRCMSELEAIAERDNLELIHPIIPIWFNQSSLGYLVFSL